MFAYVENDDQNSWKVVKNRYCFLFCFVLSFNSDFFNISSHPERQGLAVADS